ncbi:MAG: hypothetical protein VX498_16085 [Myxococcota bacterium]|nr:hypothetical protein [Myxococcota bacterium]
MSSAASDSTSAVRDLLDRGLVKFALGYREDAISLWQEALEGAPGNARALDYLRSVGAVSLDPDSGVNTLRSDERVTDEVEPPAPAAAAGARRPPFTDEMPAHKAEPAPVRPPPEPDEGDSVITDVELLLLGAQEAEDEGELEQALDRVEQVLKREPDHLDAANLAEDLRRRLADTYRAAFEPLDAVPYLRATDASILELSLDPIGGFLISQIDGEITVEELLTILGTFDEFRVLSALHFFLENGIIELKSERKARS